MYSYEARLRAVKLYLKLGRRMNATLRQLGYSNKNSLKAWCAELEENRDLRKGYQLVKRRYTDEQKHWAVDHYVGQGHSLIHTIRCLGYPFNDPAFEKLCREHDVWGTAESALNAVFWRTAIDAYQLQQWQPLEAAPRGGSMILLGRPANEDQEQDALSIPGFWQVGREDSIDDMGCDSGFVDVNFQESSGGRSFGAESYRCAPNQPSLWQPVPPPPSEQSR